MGLTEDEYPTFYLSKVMCLSIILTPNTAAAIVGDNDQWYREDNRKNKNFFVIF